MFSKNSNFTKINTLFSRVKHLRGRHLPKGSIRNSMATGAFWSLCGAVFSRGFTLLSSIIIARLLGKAGFGLWGLVMTSVSMFAQFSSLGMTLTATKYVAELKKTDPLRAGRCLSLIIIMGIMSIFLAALTCFGLSGIIANRLFNVSQLHVPLMFSSMMLFGMVTTFMLQGALAGFEDFRGIARINLVQGVVLFVVAIPLAYIFGLTGTVIGMSISQCVAAFMCFIKILQKSREYGMPLGLHRVWEERGILWHYTAPSLLTGFVTGPASMFSKALVANSAGGILSMGGFTAAFRWRDMILFIPGAVKRVTLPMLSKLKGEKDFHRFVKVLWANIALNGGIALAGAIPIMILSPWILSLYGPGFREDWGIMVILVGSGVFQAVNDVVTQVTACMEKMWWNFFIHVVWGTIVLGGSYLLVPNYGVRGYVWSFSLATIVHMFLNISAAIVIIRTTNFSGGKTNGLCEKA